MCIVADSVNDVSKTKIGSFHVAYLLNTHNQPVNNNDLEKFIVPAQLVVYSANVDSATNTNAFILPVYNPGNDYNKIIPLDLSHLPDFFVDVDRIFDRWFPKQHYGSFSLMNDSYSVQRSNSELLVVHKVGDYKFSIMPSKMDFNRINREQLNINSVAKIAVDVHSNDYSFIVYQFFQKGKIEVTPFGYICPAYREYAMIVPTIHGHDHGANNLLTNPGFGQYYTQYSPYKTEFADQAEFDHEIYAIIKSSSPNNIVKKNDVVDLDKFIKKITTDYMNRKLQLYIPKTFTPQKIKLSGMKSNRNLLITGDSYQFIQDLTIEQGSSPKQPKQPDWITQPSNPLFPMRPTTSMNNMGMVNTMNQLGQMKPINPTHPMRPTDTTDSIFAQLDNIRPSSQPPAYF